jgi:hypothetical protein
MTKKAFVAEHRHLIGLLKAHVDGTKGLETEMKKQQAELKKGLKKK